VDSWACSAWIVLRYALQIFRVAMLLYALVSWVPSLRGKWSEYIARVVEPVLAPVRRVVPPLGGLDVAFLLVLIALSYVIGAIPPVACYYR